MGDADPAAAAGTRLEDAGLKVCLDQRDFRPGAPSVKEMARAVQSSRKPVLVLAPAYLASAWAEFERLVLQTLDPAARELRLIPLLKIKRDLPLEIGYLTYVNFADPDDEDEDAGRRDEGSENLYYLFVEFLGYLRREEAVPYTKVELARGNLLAYILERHDGELEPGDSSFGERKPSGKRKSKTSSARRALLCPDRGTLDRFLVRFLSFFNFQRYPAAATFELIPAWLRFLESRGLIDTEQRTQTLAELRGLATDLRKVWEEHTADPALGLEIERWRANAGLS